VKLPEGTCIFFFNELITLVETQHEKPAHAAWGCSTDIVTMTSLGQWGDRTTSGFISAGNLGKKYFW
jgi:hypothetical protein